MKELLVFFGDTHTGYRLEKIQVSTDGTLRFNGQFTDLEDIKLKIGEGKILTQLPPNSRFDISSIGYGFIVGDDARFPVKEGKLIKEILDLVKRAANEPTS